MKGTEVLIKGCSPWSGKKGVVVACDIHSDNTPYGDGDYNVFRVRLGDGTVTKWLPERWIQVIPKSQIIYVSGPYSADTLDGKLQNTQTAIDVGIELIRKGHVVIIPHLSHYTDMRAQEKDIDIPWSEWMRQDLAILEKCDALYYIAPSRGADIELARAKELGLKIYYSVDEVPEAN